MTEPHGLQLRHTLTGHGADIGSIGWSPDGKLLASPSYDKRIGLWDAHLGTHLRWLEGHTHLVFSVA